jgi:hypothetical protein
MSLVYRYVVYPWRSRNKPLASGGVAMPRIDLATISPDAADRFAETARDLAAAGFTSALYFRQPDHPDAPNRQAYLAVWLHEADGALARAIWIRLTDPIVRFTMTSYALGFTTTFADDREVVTTNTPTVSVFPLLSTIDGLAWKDMNHAAMLWKLHRARAQRLRNGQMPVMPPPGSDGVDALVRDSERRVIDHAIGRGYLRRDADGEIRHTLRGSYLMTWRLLWPWRHIAMARQARKLRRTLAEFPELAAEARALPPSQPAVVEQIGSP